MHESHSATLLLRTYENSGQRIRDGSGRNTPEVTGTWKQYSGRKISRFFSGAFRSLSCAFPPETGRKSPENIRNFPAGILLPCSDDFRCIPAGSSVFSVSFLQVPSRTGHRNPRPENIINIFDIQTKFVRLITDNAANRLKAFQNLILPGFEH